MKNLILIFLIALTSSSAFGQVSGYLGKRISIEGDINILPNFTNFILSNDTRETYEEVLVSNYQYNSTTGNYEETKISQIQKKDKKLFAPNNMRFIFKSTLAINFTLSRKVDLSLRLNKIYGNFMFSEIRTSGNNQLYFDKNIKYQTTGLDFNFKFYRRNFVAPVGKYILFGIGYSKVNSQNNTGTLITFERTPEELTYSIDDETFSQKSGYLKINFGFGNKKVLKNNLYIIYGVENNTYLRVKDGVNSSDSDVLKRFKRNFNYHLTKNLNNDNLFCLKIGLGIIL